METDIIEGVDFKYHNSVDHRETKEITKKNLRFKNKHLNDTKFNYFNIDQAILRYNREVKKILNDKVIYFGNRDLTIFDLLTKKNVDNTANELSDKILNSFWNRKFFWYILEWNDKKANSITKYLEFLLPSPIKL